MLFWKKHNPFSIKKMYSYKNNLKNYLTDFIILRKYELQYIYYV